VTFATLFAVAFGGAAQYPAGVDPAKCPGFPICDNAALHNQAPAHSAPHWQQQQWQQPKQWQQWEQPQQYQWQEPKQWAAPAPQWAAPAPAYNHNQVGEINGKGGDKFPAGVDARACPNYPYCDSIVLPAGHSASHHQGQYRPAPLAGFKERLYPAGVSPAQCPNYPEC
jgi:hypothetical protein